MPDHSPRYHLFPDLPDWTPGGPTVVRGLRERLDLCLALQRSLSVEVILETFLGAMHQQCKCIGLSFQTEQGRLTFGTETTAMVSERLKLHGVRLGDLTLYFEAGTSAPRERIEDWLSLLLPPLHNAKVHTEALAATLCDSLTGAGNRAGFEVALGRELARAERTLKPLSLVLVELDDFDGLLDRYGHAMGDAVVAKVVRVLTAVLRATDQVFRLEGPEFAIVLADTDSGAALAVGGRLCDAIAALRVKMGRQATGATASLGAATTQGGDGAQLFARAATALHQAQQAGRNRIAIN